MELQIRTFDTLCESPWILVAIICHIKFSHFHSPSSDSTTCPVHITVQPVRFSLASLNPEGDWLLHNNYSLGYQHTSLGYQHSDRRCIMAGEVTSFLLVGHSLVALSWSMKSLRALTNSILISFL